MQNSAIRITKKHSTHHKKNEQSHAKSTTNLQTLKKTTQNFPLLQPTLQMATQRAEFMRQSKSRGKLRMGSTSKPLLVLSKEQRKNPFHKESLLSEDMVNKKGLLQLTTMGVLNKQVDCYQLLNMRYQVQPKPVEMNPTFLTNPAILISTYYEKTKQDQTQQAEKSPIQIKEKVEDAVKMKKVKSLKKKVVKQEEPVFFIQETIKLTFVNGRFQVTDIYEEYMKMLKRKGLDLLFKMYKKKIQEFSKKYNLKKFTIVPELNETKRITDQDILKAIPNSKILGFHRRLKGTSMDVLANLVYMKMEKMRFRLKKQAIRRLQKVKNKFKIKRFYREMLSRRWQYLNFKLGAFAQGQRRAMESSTTRFDVEIHLIASDRNPSELTTFYKYKERSMAQLLRLYNTQTDHIILIHDGSVDCQDWLQEIQTMPKSWKKPTIHLFETSLRVDSKEGLQESADIYFGLTSKIIRQIKKICYQRKTVLVPYKISKFLPYICQALNVELFAGTFSPDASSILFEEESAQQKTAMDTKFKKLMVNSLEMTTFYRTRINKITLANSLYHSKAKIKQLFKELQLPTPPSLSNADINNRDFFRQFVKCILKEKDVNRWILKLPTSTFSRGLALLETDSLKIIKQNKKKQTVSEQIIDQIAKIMQSILVQKVFIPHNSLTTGQEFVSAFKMSDGYIQSYFQGMVSVSVFGRIDFNGLWTLLGSYRKYYAEYICFGASYPGFTVTNDLRSALVTIANVLYKQNVFGYLTIQLLLQPKSGQFYFIDLVPHLEAFSCLYFYYRRLLDMNEFEDNNFDLKRKLFYCPFIDNNGNKTANLGQFRQMMAIKKIKFDQNDIIGTRIFRLGEGAEVLGVLSVGLEEGAVVRECLDALRAMVQIGGQFNKFDKRTKNKQSDGLYILDIIWKLRQLKKQQQ